MKNLKLNLDGYKNYSTYIIIFFLTNCSVNWKRKGGVVLEVGTEAQLKKGRKNDVSGVRAPRVLAEAVE
jgi:hypothetical protein